MSKRFNKSDLYTKLARLAFRLTHPPSMRHVAHSLPHLRLKPEGSQWDIYWRKQKLSTTKAWHTLKDNQTQKMFVIGSGPSIKEQDLSRIGEQPALVVNGAASLIKNGTLQNPIGLVIEDARFVQQRPEFIANLPKHIPIFASPSVLQTIGAINSNWLAEHPYFLMQSFTQRHWQPKKPIEAFNPNTFVKGKNANLSLDSSLGSFGCGTVMYRAAQVALMFNTKEIALVGLDLTNFDQPRFYESKNDQAWTGLQNAYESRILPAFTLFKQVCDERGIRLTNCSHTSIVPREVLPFNDELMPD